MGKINKTNVMRLLEQAGIDYEAHQYKELATEQINKVYKTLVTEGKTGNHYVFLVPVQAELNLKKAAKAVSEKSIAMIKEKELLPLTGYVHGGCSPIGMKKEFPTIVDAQATAEDTILFSAGKKGLSVEVNPNALLGLIQANYADVQNG